MEILQDILKIIDWNRIKARLHISNAHPYPYKKEIWWASLGQNIGVEINGKNNKFERPVLVIRVFNTHSSFISPITSTLSDKKFIISFTNLVGENNSTNISQLRTISNKRLLRKIGEISDTEFEKVLETIRETVLKTKTPLGVISES